MSEPEHSFLEQLNVSRENFCSRKALELCSGHEFEAKLEMQESVDLFTCF